MTRHEEQTRDAGALSCATNGSPLLLSRDDAATLLGVHRNTISNLRRRGELPATLVGRRVMWSRETLEAYIATNTEGGN